MVYDPIRSKNNAEDFMYDYSMGMLEEEEKYIGDGGLYCFYSTLKATLIGSHNRFLPVLNRAIDWMQKGINNNESKSTIFFHQSRLHENLALALWFRDEIDKRDIWQEAISLHQKSVEIEEPYLASRIKTVMLADRLLYCLHAQEYEQGIETYRQYHGDKKPTRKQLFNSEAKLAYALCLHYADNQYSPEELHSALNGLLNLKVDSEWIGRGNPSKALSWLKVAYWNRKEALSPLEVWLKAYDHMPRVTRPCFAV